VKTNTKRTNFRSTQKKKKE